MDDFKFNAPAPDAAYLGHVNTFFTALYGLEIFKTGWPEGKLGSQVALQNGVEYFQQKYQGGLTGNRLDIAARKAARKELDVRIQKILYYLSVMADESDITALLNTGVVSQKNRKKARRGSKSQVAN